MMPDIGTITLTVADTSTRDVQFTNARAERLEYDRHLFRAPYGTTWHASGTGDRQPETVRLSIEAWHEEGIRSAAAAVASLIDDLHAAVTVTLPWGSFTSAGVLSVARSPIANGYRLEVVMATQDGVTP